MSTSLVCHLHAQSVNSDLSPSDWVSNDDTSDHQLR